MASVQQVLEIERVVNLVKGFDWQKIQEVVEDDLVTITIQKSIKPGVLVPPPA